MGITHPMYGCRHHYARTVPLVTTYAWTSACPRVTSAWTSPHPMVITDAWMSPHPMVITDAWTSPLSPWCYEHRCHPVLVVTMDTWMSPSHSCHCRHTGMSRRPCCCNTHVDVTPSPWHCLCMDITHPTYGCRHHYAHTVPLVTTYTWTSACPHVTSLRTSPHPVVTTSACMSPCPHSHCVCVDVTLSLGSLHTGGHHPVPMSLLMHGQHPVPVATWTLVHPMVTTYAHVSLSPCTQLCQPVPTALCTHDVIFSQGPRTHRDITLSLWSLHTNGHHLVPMVITYTWTTPCPHGHYIHMDITLS